MVSLYVKSDAAAAASCLAASAALASSTSCAFLVSSSASADAAAGCQVHLVTGAPGPSKFFASPWGKGGNVTEFCYETRTGTAAKTSTLAAAITATDTTVVLAQGGLDKLGVLIGDYIHVNMAVDADTDAAGTALSTTATTADTVLRPAGRAAGNALPASLRANLPLPTTGEYMRVTSIDYNFRRMTVIRNVVPNCLPANLDNSLVFPNSGVVNLVTPVHHTIQLWDSVTKMAGRVPGLQQTIDATGEVSDVGTTQGSRDSGRCAMSSPVYVGTLGRVMSSDPFDLAYKTLVLVGAAQDAAGKYDTPLKAGGYIQIEMEYMLVTHVNTADADGDTVPDAVAASLSLTVVRGVRPPCLIHGDPMAHAVGSHIFLIVSGGCYRDSDGLRSFQLDSDFAIALGSEDLAPTDTTIVVGATAGMEVGGYLKIGPLAFATEYALITDIDTINNIVSVVRNAAPRCLKSIASNIYIPAFTENAIMVLGVGTMTLATKPARSNNMISTSMRVVVELSPREMIQWVDATDVSPTPEPSPPSPPPAYANTLLQACSISHSWSEMRSLGLLVSRPAYSRYVTGGLGALMVEDLYEVWLCDREDPCLVYSFSVQLSECLQEITVPLAYERYLQHFFNESLTRENWVATDSDQSTICSFVQHALACFSANECEFLSLPQNLGNDWIDQFFYNVTAKLAGCNPSCGGRNSPTTLETDMMCYVYNEEISKFLPIDISSNFIESESQKVRSEVSRSQKVRSQNTGDYGLPEVKSRQVADLLVSNLESLVVQPGVRARASTHSVSEGSSQKRVAKLSGKSPSIKRGREGSTRRNPMPQMETSGMSTSIPHPNEEESRPSPASKAKSLAVKISQRLSALQHLLDDGLISNAEFDSQRNAIIAAI